MKNVIRFMTITSTVCSLVAGLCGTINQCIEVTSVLKAQQTKQNKQRRKLV